MSLVTYEFNRAEYAGEISQFRDTLPILQQKYQGRKEFVLYLGGRLNINGVDIDGLIIKGDAIILIEFKNYSGKIKAQVNGDWFHDNERINGGATKKDGETKTVFEQLCYNRRMLREGCKAYIKNFAACDNIQALVVFRDITSLDLDPDFSFGANAWVHVTDVAGIGEGLDKIKATAKNKTAIYIPKAEILDFIRNKGLDERYLMMKYSDVNLLPSDLYHEDEVHNGDDFSPNTLLAKAQAENEQYKTSLHDAVEMLTTVMQKMEDMTGEKDTIIQQQKAELLQLQADLLEERKRMSKSPTDDQALAAEEAALITEVQAVAQEINQIKPTEKQPEQKAEVPVKKRFGLKQKVLKDFNVETDSMDDDQLELIEKTLDKSMIVAGCAGSGKSVIAMYKAQQIMDAGGDVILIAFTKSLNLYMSQGKPNSLGQRFYYHWQWQNQGMPQADYIIVDEIQDFEQQEILEFVHAAKKHFFFFGDTAQSIYGTFGKKTLSIDEISKLTGITISRLYNNYRLPKPVAKITQDYLGLSEQADMVPPYSDSLYLSQEKALPIMIETSSEQSQAALIMKIIQAKHYRSVGILVPDNETVLKIMKQFNDAKFVCEFKYNTDDYKNRPRNTIILDFKSDAPKLMTYHSAKGLQFETVILPYYSGAMTTDTKKALYVAMTRTYRNLYIFYHAPLAAPLSNVPERLYERLTSNDI